MCSLKRAFTNYDGYLAVVECFESEQDEEDDKQENITMTDYETFNLRMKSYYLLTLY